MPLWDQKFSKLIKSIIFETGSIFNKIAHKNNEAESAEDGRTVHRIERTAGDFRRVIEVNLPVDEDAIAAAYDNGVLKVTLPKSEEVRPKRIEIQTASSSN